MLLDTGTLALPSFKDIHLHSNNLSWAGLWGLVAIAHRRAHAWTQSHTASDQGTLAFLTALHVFVL